MPSFIARQGDVLIISVDSIPETATPVPHAGSVILAEGEQTGHHHSIAVAHADVELFTVADEVDRFLRVRSRALLTHQEHATIAIPPGTYRVVRQVEYTPQAVQRVAD